MEKPNILKILPAILGFLGFALPAIGGDNGDVAIWSFGALIEEGESHFLKGLYTAESESAIILMPISGFVFVVGAVLALLSALGVLKLGKVAWLPGLIMIVGVPLFFIGTGDTEILYVAPVVINVICGGVGGVWALVDGIKSMNVS